MPAHDVVVIGASAGSLKALLTLVHALPVTIPASLFVVLHIPARSPGHLPEILSHAGPLMAKHPQNGEQIEHGQIY